MVFKQKIKISSQEKPSKYPLLWSFAFGGIFIFGVVATIFLILFIFVNTPMGKNYIATQIQKRTHNQIQIQNISGFFPTHLNITEIQFKTENVGVWLTVKDVNLNWSPWDLLWNELSIHSLVAKEVDLYTLPPKGIKLEKLNEGNKTIDSPLRVNIQHIKIDQFFISEQIANRKLYITIDGQVEIRNLFQIMNVDILKTAFMTRPKFRLFDVQQSADFQFAGKISGSVEEKNEKQYNTPLVPLRFSVILPQYSTEHSHDKVKIYVGLGDKI